VSRKSKNINRYSGDAIGKAQQKEISKIYFLQRRLLEGRREDFGLKETSRGYSVTVGMHRWIKSHI
jgi:DNA primase catalytic subunit